MRTPSWSRAEALSPSGAALYGFVRQHLRMSGYHRSMLCSPRRLCPQTWAGKTGFAPKQIRTLRNQAGFVPVYLRVSGYVPLQHDVVPNSFYACQGRGLVPKEMDVITRARVRTYVRCLCQGRG